MVLDKANWSLLRTLVTREIERVTSDASISEDERQKLLVDLNQLSFILERIIINLERDKQK